MSHFSVLVIGKDIDTQLAPFQENNMSDCPKEFLVFEKTNLEEKKKDYLNDTTSKGIPLKEEYSTFKDYLEDYCSEQIDDEMGEYGYWTNPNSKWDWYVVGGRWSNMLTLKNGQKVNSALAKDIDFDFIDKEESEKARIRWELWVEGREPENDEETKILKEQFYKTEYYLGKYKTKENYVRLVNEISTHAVLKKGKWFESGEMGWFGCNNATADEEYTWYKNFRSNFIDKLKPNDLVTIVDCHI